MKRKLRVRDDQEKLHVIDFTCCDLCGVGSGITFYPDEEFKHDQEVLNVFTEFGESYELCNSCLKCAKKYKGYAKKYLIDAPMVMNRTKRTKRRGKRSRPLTRFFVTKRI